MIFTDSMNTMITKIIVQEKSLNYDFTDLMKTMITKIIAHQIITKIKMQDK